MEIRKVHAERLGRYWVNANYILRLLWEETTLCRWKKKLWIIILINDEKFEKNAYKISKRNKKFYDVTCVLLNINFSQLIRKISLLTLWNCLSLSSYALYHFNLRVSPRYFESSESLIHRCTASSPFTPESRSRFGVVNGRRFKETL